MLKEQPVSVGTAVVIESLSPSLPFGVVFEDDGDSGYFYGLDLDRESEPILAALHVYTVTAVVNRERTVWVRIVWSQDGGRAALLIDRQPHAVFDFIGRRGYCRTNFPEPVESWTGHDYAWDERAMAWFESTHN